VFILWRRRRAIEATFGGSEPLDEGAVGRVVTVEGVLSASLEQIFGLGKKGVSN
jgi:hypothetical protein